MPGAQMVSNDSNNCTAENTPLYDFLSAVMIVEFILALPLNISVLYLFIFKMKFWKSNSNMVFLFNMVLADILLLICLPVKAYQYQNGQRRSEEGVVCKAMLFMLFLNRGASIAFLTVISIDRYFLVVQKKNLLKVMKKSPLISVLIWVLLLPLTVPTMLRTFECCNSHGREKDNFTDTLREIVFFTQILIPFAILVFCTVQVVRRLKRKTVGNKTKLRRAVFLVTSVVLVFSVCFLPCTISRMVLLIVRVKELYDIEEIAVQVYDGLMCFSYMDCLLDPLVYCFCSTNFKNLYLSKFFPFLLSKDGQHTDSTNSSGNTPNPKRVNTVKEAGDLL
ncbi:12-(S)-hydroxy-5,8,10,14-eicosatetraenoic acid receptor-like [Megalops cyprinoides]|uniref:12-(S)-hydroxy-5,8,10,14-eicosatetraenoic acid receptor-like n=1 Tax=Megalops cyprinoides TaxID=118141 RepID=UPI001863A9C2|nr:12-(S)-hydroxy-5,8,10,14-eicosatetraenoic acid receptor-like [Megalops cyprinoides]